MEKKKGPRTQEMLNVAKLISSEAQGISLISEWEEYFQTNYKLSLPEALRLSKEWKQYITIPVTSFSKELGALESTVAFLHDTHHLSFSEMGKMLNRNPRTIWTAYSKSKEKVPFALVPRQTSVQIPLYLLADRKHTIMEIVCSILKEHYGLTNHKIATHLHRSDSFVWITLRRHRQKKKK